MGQLERYGLYVLCLVIFLILGVAIWGDGADASSGTSTAGVIQKTDKRLKTEEEKLDEFNEFLRKQKNDEIKNQDDARGLFEPVNDDDAKEKKKEDTPPVPPTPIALRTHTVKKNDNLEAISLRYLGKKNLWRKILAINPDASERRLKLGMVLKIPHRGSSAKPIRTAPGGRFYTVRKGDNAWKIAKRHYGESKAMEYAERILELNAIEHAGALIPGTKISLPQ
jgi:nucleoid-associated protein YgaU